LLPLFPLHVVLFPGMPMPLHIFEQRYRLMISHCLEAGTGFGVVLIRSGREVGEAATPYEVGTMAEIVRHEVLADGRMNLLCVGRERFRIISMGSAEPYLTGEVEPVVDEDVEAGELAARVASRVRAFAAAIGAPDLALPDDPAALSFRVAQIVPMELAERQALLAETSPVARLRSLAAAVERELHLRQRVGDTRHAAPGSLGDISKN
jgi:Lon protease-like protein